MAKWRDAARAVAGPALIVGAVCVLMRGFVAGRISAQHPDILAFWLPTYCHLGRSLAGGHIPAWNPAVMGGVPFAADPQSGWMSLPVMALFAVLPCGAALAATIVLNPILAGLGIYWFARAEGLSRPAATVGGLALAVPLASTRLGLFLPFPAALAWTALLLAAAAQFVRAATWPARLGWAGLAAGAWGQLAAAHAGHGLVIGTAVVGTYLAAGLICSVRRGERSWTGAAVAIGLLIPITLAVNLAYLVPRLAYLPRTSYQAGYADVAQLNGREPGWPLHLGSSPGLYLGAVVLSLALAAFWSRRRRALVAAFASFGAACYVLSLNVVADHLGPALAGVPVLDFYRHYPGRFVLGTLLAICVLAAIGVEAWLEATTTRQRAIRLVPGLAVWFVLPLAVGLSPAHRWLLLLGAVVGGVALLASARRPGLAYLVPIVVAVELVTNGLLGQAGGRVERGLSPDLLAWFQPLRVAQVEPGDYLRVGPLAEYLRGHPGARYISLDPEAVSARGYLTHQSPSFWGLLANQRATLLGLEDAQGYNPFQLERYWSFVRRVSPIALDYNAAVFPSPPPSALDLLDVGWVVGPEGSVPSGQGAVVARDGPWALYRLASVPPRAQVVSASAVTGAELLGNESAIGSVGQATYRPLGDQAARVDVTAREPAVVLVRNSFDTNWRAEVDGKPVPILPAFGVVQGVPVPAGSHEVTLRYDDPSIAYGLLGSILAVTLLAMAALLLRRRSRRSPSSALLDLSNDSEKIPG